MQALAGQGNDGQWHGYLHETLLCTIHEAKVGSKRYEVDDAVRSKLTEMRLMLNLKFGANGMFDIFCRFMMGSNAADALVLTERDRRMQVTDSDNEERSEEYYEKLYALLKDGTLAAEVFWALRGRDIASFNPGMRAPMSDAKQRMIATTDSDASWAIKELRKMGVNMITTEQLRNHVGETEEVSDQAAVGALKEHAVNYGPRVKIAGRDKTVWIIGLRRKAFLQMSKNEARAEVARTPQIIAEFREGEPDYGGGEPPPNLADYRGKRD